MARPIPGDEKDMVDSLQMERPRVRQPSLPGLCPIADALAKLSRAGPEFRGAVFTKREVVEFILDLVGYTIDRPLWNFSLLEPSCGDGDFILPAIERLLASWMREGRPIPVRQLTRCIRAIELHQITCEETRSKVFRALRSAGIRESDAAALTECWLAHGDFLLTDFPSTYEFVVGNPPYVRQELIPDALVSEYRARYETVFDRADLYVPFIERSRNGLVDANIHLRSTVLTLPGYFRPTKLWDLVVVNQNRLVAALEFKSQVGPSFGNNFNNRVEEAIGSAHDFWTAYRKGAFGADSRPFLGWLILVEDAEASRKPVRDSSPHFPISREFAGTSYSKRYDILCQKLVQESLYSAASILLSPRLSVADGSFSEMSESTSLRTFAAGLAGHVAAESVRRDSPA